MNEDFLTEVRDGGDLANTVGEIVAAIGAIIAVRFNVQVGAFIAAWGSGVLVTGFALEAWANRALKRKQGVAVKYKVWRYTYLFRSAKAYYSDYAWNLGM